MDLAGLLQLIARREPGLPDLCCLLVSRKALPEYPIHITLGEDASTSATPMRDKTSSWLSPSSPRTDDDFNFLFERRTRTDIPLLVNES